MDVTTDTLVVAAITALGVAVTFLGIMLVQARNREERTRQQIRDAVNGQIGELLGGAFGTLLRLEEKAKDEYSRLESVQQNAEAILKTIETKANAAQSLADSALERAQATSGAAADVAASLAELRELRDEVTSIASTIRERAGQAEAEADDISRIHEQTVANRALESRAIEVFRQSGAHMEYDEYDGKAPVDFVARFDREGMPSIRFGVIARHIADVLSTNQISSALVDAQAAVNAGRVHYGVIVTNRVLRSEEQINSRLVFTKDIDGLQDLIEAAIENLTT